MGTSSSYGGPPNHSPLLPPWAPPVLDPDPSPEPDQAPDAPVNPSTDGNASTPPGHSQQNTVTHTQPSCSPSSAWRHAKTAMSRMASGGGGTERIGRAARAYVAAKGGRRAAAASALGGRSTARSVGSFISGAASTGFTSALERLGLRQLVGRPPEEALAVVVDRLAPVGTDIEESAAREATIEALAFLYDEYGSDSVTAGEIDFLGEDAARRVFQEYVASYIRNRWLRELGIRIEMKAMSPEAAVGLERQVKDYIGVAVELDFGNDELTALQWDEADERITAIFEEAYSMLEQEQ